ncbi:PAS domain-containing protein [Aquiflexum gelatinilyticum]|uniref:PAS domain-containing protein n=1 Tax=Aquiflexum gelatinilyticum TaxID=2961943 RepID=UPI00216A2157|nr:PAS domain-containing protein [Aquiflexum gelatinilyticum]MCS4436406.1 PAS domain-containing protein [Aquiflexum gelatinilyticum]
MKDFFKHSDYFYYICLDRDANILDSNEHLQKETRFLNHALEGSSFSELVYYKDFSNYQSLLEKSLMEGERKFTLDIRKIKSDGLDFYWTKWEFTIISGNSENIEILGVGHIIENVNEKSVQFPDSINDLHAKNSLMEGLLEENLIGFWIWDIAQQSDQLSLSLNEVFGYSAIQKTKGQKNVKWKKHIHPSDKSKVETHLKEHFASNGKLPFHCEFRIKNLHKKDIWVLGYGKVLQWSPEGDPLVMAGCFFDISERKKTESLFRQQTQYLTTVTFNQTHLMRAKLANIIGILEIIDPKKPSMETLHFLKMIKTEARKLDEELRKSISASSSLQNTPPQSENQALMI